MSAALRDSRQTTSTQRSLLTSAADAPGEAPFDLWDRYVQAARFLNELCDGVKTPVRVLDVGCNVVTLLGQLLDPAQVQVVRCDVIDGPADDSEYVKLEPGQPLPFEDESFDAVVALEVLEHVDAGQRSDFLGDLERVARCGVVISCPTSSPAVVAAERLAAEAYLLRHGEPHPFLREHAEFGLPTVEQVCIALERLDRNFNVVPGISVDRWLAATLLTEGVLERGGSGRLQQELTQAFAKRPSEASPYRHYFVINKRLAATRSGARDSESVLRSASRLTEFEPAVALNHLLETSSEVLTSLDHAHGHLPAALRAVIREQQNGLDLQELRYQIAGSFAEALTQSWGWKLLAPLRAVKNMLRPRGFDQSHFLAWKQLEPIAHEPGGWQALGDDPQFLVSCYLPAGWLRVRLKCMSSIKTRLEMYAETAGGFTAGSLLGEWSIVEGRNDEEFFVYLDQPTRALRIDPLNAKGAIHIERFEVTPRPAPYAVADALRRKLRLLRAYHNTLPVLLRGLKLLATGRWREVANKWALGLDDPRCTRHGFYEPDKAYEKWIVKHALTEAERTRQREWADGLADPPVISLALPTYNTPERYLRLALDSVVRQTYPHWELCIADDGSTEPHVRSILAEYVTKDQRIKLAPPEKHGGISHATNAALAQATGEFVALFDHDDELAENALYKMARAIVEQPDADVLYSDEDKIQPDGKRVNPFFKPDWSPEFFLGCMYTCHLSLYRTALVNEVGGFDPAFDGAQDYDLALRVIEKARRVVHVPDVLYHWRLLPNSTASGVAAKPHAHASALRALEAHLQRSGREGRAEVGPSAGLSFVRFAVQGTSTVSIIIPTLGTAATAPGRDVGFVENCLSSIRRLSTWRHFEVIVLDRNTLDAGVAQRIIGGNVRRITYDESFNWSKVNNLGMRKARGEFLLFLNDDTEVITPGWLEAMLELAQQNEIGAVGAKLQFPDGGLQHVGVTVLDGNPGHPFYGYPKQHPGYFCRNMLPHNCAAVTGACLMTRTEVFREVGGFDEGLPLNYNDVDYCYRLRQAGYRIVYTPHAVLTHFESVSKPGVFKEELRAFQKRWDKKAGDPFYNPNLNTETFDYRIAG